MHDEQIPNFTHEELQQLAANICERYDALMEIATDSTIRNEEWKKGSRKSAEHLASLNAKLRPYYAG